MSSRRRVPVVCWPHRSDTSSRNFALSRSVHRVDGQGDGRHGRLLRDPSLCAARVWGVPTDRRRADAILGRACGGQRSTVGPASSIPRTRRWRCSAREFGRDVLGQYGNAGGDDLRFPRTSFEGFCATDLCVLLGASSRAAGRRPGAARLMIQRCRRVQSRLQWRPGRGKRG